MRRKRVLLRARVDLALAAREIPLTLLILTQSFHPRHVSGLH